MNNMDFSGVIKDVHDQLNKQLHVEVVATYTSITDTDVNTMDFSGVIKDSHDQDNHALRLKFSNGLVIIGVV
jgi:hypothetical protein